MQDLVRQFSVDGCTGKSVKLFKQRSDTDFSFTLATLWRQVGRWKDEAGDVI